MGEFKVILKDGISFVVKGKRIGRTADSYGLVTFIEDEDQHEVFAAYTPEILAIAESSYVTEEPRADATE